MSRSQPSREPFNAQQRTLGSLLRESRLVVPNYQREYSWTKQEVVALLSDFDNALRGDSPVYFLGCIVLTRSSHLTIIDGQQRLATTSIIVATIRDQMIKLGEEDIASSIESDYLLTFDRRGKEAVGRMTLNSGDNNFFYQNVLLRPRSEDKVNTPPSLSSHHRIKEAKRLIADKIRRTVAARTGDEAKVSALNDWLDFVQERASVVALTAPTSQNAYHMFATLNDRGLGVTQADLLKSYLFEKADERLEEAKHAWASVRAVIEPAEIDGGLLTFLRHSLTLRRGLTREEELYDRIQPEIKTAAQAVSFLNELTILSEYYTALVNQAHQTWQGLPIDAANAIYRMANELRTRTFRPLLLAAVARMTKTQLKTLVPKVENWSVRFLICGGHRSERVERRVADVAKKVYAKDIDTTARIASELKGVLPNDEQFHESFATASVSTERVARYYLRRLSLSADGQLQPSAETRFLSLEHILPKRFEDRHDWSEFSDEEHKAFYNRLGNFALIPPEANSASRSASFDLKKKMIEDASGIAVNADILKYANDNEGWTPQAVRERQLAMADRAIKTWPL